MEFPEKMSLKEAKVIIQKMLNKEQNILSLAQLMKYSEQSEMIELAMRCVCIDKDIENLKGYATALEQLSEMNQMYQIAESEIDEMREEVAKLKIAYDINNTNCVLETDDEIRIFWSALHPNDLLVLAYINQNYVGAEN